VENLRIIVLNSVLWSDHYGEDCGFPQKNPGAAQMDWLTWQLYSLKQHKKKALLLMHVPPGINAFTTARASVPYYGAIESFWRPEYNEQFQGRVETYGELRRYAFAGAFFWAAGSVAVGPGESQLADLIHPELPALAAFFSAWLRVGWLLTVEKMTSVVVAPYWVRLSTRARRCTISLASSRNISNSVPVRT
jgi:hypothetical protein